MTGTATQVSGSPCEASAAVAACPVIRGIGVIVRTIVRSPRCTNSFHELFVQPSLRAPSKCGRRGAWTTARSAGGSCLSASAPATCPAVSGGSAAIAKLPTLIHRHVTLILCRPFILLIHGPGGRVLLVFEDEIIRFLANNQIVQSVPIKCSFFIYKGVEVSAKQFMSILNPSFSKFTSSRTLS